MPSVGFVLVHGGLHSAWTWDRLRPLLECPSLAVELPGRGSRPAPLGKVRIADYVDAVVADAEAWDFEEIVLVGHSLAGLSIPAAAERLGRRVRHLVFASSLVPRDGARAVDLMPRPMQPLIQWKLSRGLATNRGFMLPTVVARWAFCQDLDPAGATDLLHRLSAEPPNPILERLRRPELPEDLPRTYLGFQQDRLIPKMFQRRMAASINATWVGVPGGHDAVLSQPEPVATFLNAIAARHH
jgi:pimeloyl-ACP methyl ester carboxylesterase